MSLQFCPYCGKPRAAADATFCGYCGRSFDGSATNPAGPVSLVSTASAANATPPPIAASPYAPPPASSPPSSAYPAYPGYPTPAPAANYYGATVAPSAQPALPAMPVAGRKSAGVAIVLEWFVPGVGAMYAGAVGLGIGWLLGTYAWGLIASVMLLSTIREVNQPTPFAVAGQDYTPLIAVALILSALGIGWFVIRLLVVNEKIRAFNQRLAGGISTGASGQPGQANPFDGGRAASSGALALAVSILPQMLVLAGLLSSFYESLAQALFNDVLLGVATLLPFAFAVAIFRLPQTPWWRALIEVTAGIAIMQFVLLAGYIVIQALLVPDFRLSYTLLVNQPIQYVIFEFLLPVLIAAGSGLAIGLLYARWQTIRGHGAGGNNLLVAGIILAIGIVALLASDAAIVGTELRAPFSTLGAIETANSVLVIAISVGAILAAAFIMRARLVKLSAVRP